MITLETKMKKFLIVLCILPAISYAQFENNTRLVSDCPSIGQACTDTYSYDQVTYLFSSCKDFIGRVFAKRIKDFKSQCPTRVPIFGYQDVFGREGAFQFDVQNCKAVADERAPVYVRVTA